MVRTNQLCYQIINNIKYMTTDDVWTNILRCIGKSISNARFSVNFTFLLLFSTNVPLVPTKFAHGVA